jgi:haloalkane dehalogenase
VLLERDYIDILGMINMPSLRTPEERFENLADFPFKPHFVNINDVRLHYIDEGNGELILCLHGEPTWSYLYRKMIPPLAQRYRVICMDFPGFGRSDKPSTIEEYTYSMFYETLVEFISQLDLQKITLVCHDWGGLIGLRVAGTHSQHFARLVIMNTGLPSGRRVNEAFMNWRNFVERTPDLPVEVVIRTGVYQSDKLTPEIISAYEAPFPDASYKMGARAWPLLVPIKPDDSVAQEMLAARQDLGRWHKPALVMFSDKDAITKGADQFFRNLIPSVTDQPEIIITDAGHFLQEEKGEEIAQHIIEFIDRSPID